jgi:hypothetical protein
MKSYTFVSKNLGDIRFDVLGKYRDGSKDIAVNIDEKNLEEVFEEMDGGSVEEIFQWLVENGVEFESDRSFYVNVNVVASVMLDSDDTFDNILNRAAKMTEEELADHKRYVLY